MTTPTKDTVADIYWYDIIKNVLSESKTSLHTVEIWEKLRDNYGYSYNKDRVIKELINIQRTGYAKSVLKNGKQAWVFPSGSELQLLERNKKIDNAIADLVETLGRGPTIEEVTTKIRKELPNNQELPKRLRKISNLIQSIDKLIKKECEQSKKRSRKEKNVEQGSEPRCNFELSGISFYEYIIDNLDGVIEDIDMLTLIRIIDARKKESHIFS